RPAGAGADASVAQQVSAAAAVRLHQGPDRRLSARGVNGRHECPWRTVTDPDSTERNQPDSFAGHCAQLPKLASREGAGPYYGEPEPRNSPFRGGQLPSFRSLADCDGYCASEGVSGDVLIFCAVAGNKKPGAMAGFLWRRDQLLDLGFLVRNVLTDNRIVLFDLDLFRSVTLVLVGRVEVTSAC